MDPPCMDYMWKSAVELQEAKPEQYTGWYIQEPTGSSCRMQTGETTTRFTVHQWAKNPVDRTILTTSLQAGLENSRGGGFQLASADGEHDAKALTGVNGTSCSWLFVNGWAFYFLQSYVAWTMRHLIFRRKWSFPRVLTGRLTGNCWRPWWDWKRAMHGDRKWSTRWRSCSWRCKQRNWRWRWWAVRKLEEGGWFLKRRLS